MLIKYIHWSEPDKTKIFDTVKALNNNPYIEKTQEDFDEFTLNKFKKDKQHDLVLSYEVI